jgi:aryl-alcohol dehydrogenase-like predicted oxidoreductase
LELILGTAQLAGRYGVMATEGASEARSVAVLDAARRLGVRTVDTAPGYEGAEAAIGLFGTGLAVHTKLPSGEDPVAALAASLERLRREYVEVLYLHDPDIVLDAEDSKLAAAAALVGAGAASLGASIYTREQFLAAVADPRITVVQAPMNVFDRSIHDEDLRLATHSGVEVIARSALLQGVLGDPVLAMGRVPLLDEALTAFHAVCEQVGRPPVELAIGWVRSRPSVVGVVLGAETSEQLEGLVRAFETPSLSDEALELLASLLLPPGRAKDPRTWPNA